MILSLRIKKYFKNGKKDMEGIFKDFELKDFTPGR
jgi:hypothetical protein